MQCAITLEILSAILEFEWDTLIDLYIKCVIKRVLDIRIVVLRCGTALVAPASRDPRRVVLRCGTALVAPASRDPRRFVLRCGTALVAPASRDPRGVVLRCGTALVAPASRDPRRVVEKERFRLVHLSANTVAFITTVAECATRSELQLRWLLHVTASRLQEY